MGRDVVVQAAAPHRTTVAEKLRHEVVPLGLDRIGLKVRNTE
ncbi:hypothetical protein NY08_3498 [Rhodococcus sp. B7740]|nr:hypothetical protein NY08_3498 [Rhodococcus sp. B7740]